MFLRRPVLFRRYERLLHVVRLHEFRAQFIRANRLSFDFEMSAYLHRCLSNVLVSLVEIAATAWFFLLIVMELYLYLSSAQIWAQRGLFNQTTTLVFFVAASGIALCLSVATKFRMSRVHWALLHDRDMVGVGTGGGGGGGGGGRSGKRYQIDLFWRRSPRLILEIFR